jgi:hypothetical protein
MITLSTSAYEKDFKFTLNKNNWFYKIQNPLITKKIVIVNNIDSIDEFLILKKEFENDFEFYTSSDYITEIHNTFNVLMSSTDTPYYYSIHHYTALLVNNDNYCFHVSPDCKIICENLSEFFEKSILLFNSDKNSISTTLSWVPPEMSDIVGKNEQSGYDNSKHNDDFFCSKNFSDQVYFYNVNRLKKVDFTNTKSLHPFPSYGINSFEYRLTNYMIVNHMYRGIFKNKSHYIHKSF